MAGTVAEVKRCVDAGAEIVRITVQGKKEAAACMAIREALFKDRCAAPGRGGRRRVPARARRRGLPALSGPPEPPPRPLTAAMHAPSAMCVFALRSPLAATAGAADSSCARGRAGTTCRWWPTSTSSPRSP